MYTLLSLYLSLQGMVPWTQGLGLRTIRSFGPRIALWYHPAPQRTHNV